MIKTASAISLALLLCACGGSQANKGGGETAPLGSDSEAAAEAPADDGAAKEAAEPAPAPDGTAAAGGEAVTMTEAEWEAAVAFSEKLADTVDANKDDCDKMASEIEVLFDGNAALITKANKWQLSASKEEQQAFAQKYEDRLAAMGAKLGPGIQKCSGHEGVVTQFQRFQ